MEEEEEEESHRVQRHRVQNHRVQSNGPPGVAARILLLSALAGLSAAHQVADTPPWCHSYADMEVATGSSEDVLLNFTHQVFSTDRGLFPGVVYEELYCGHPQSLRLKMASKRRNMFHKNKKQETTEIVKTELSGDVRDLSVSGPGGFDDLTRKCHPWWVSGEPINWGPAPLQPNITFRIRYRLLESTIVLETVATFTILQECDVWLGSTRGEVSSSVLSAVWAWLSPPCSVRVPVAPASGLLVHINRLNVACPLGRLQFQEGLRPLCGKLEEISEPDRSIYFPPRADPFTFVIHGTPVFSLSYRSVDYCYNVSLTQRNDTFEVKPTGRLECNFRVLLPYGYRVSLEMRLEGGGVVGEGEVDSGEGCGSGLQVRLQDGSSSRLHCAHPGHPAWHQRVLSATNRVTLTVTTTEIATNDYPKLTVKYEAEGVVDIVKGCPYPWIGSGQLCLAVVEEERLPWQQAEDECARLGGHLASITHQQTQALVDNMLTNSAGYRDENAYWVGATDSGLEGDFSWSDSHPFTYTNWFPGWRGQVNRQPNDDGLSEQDCVELRRLYHLPQATTLTHTFRWNDRDCSAKNYFICEKLSTGERMDAVSERAGAECNRSVSLSREQPRATIASPAFPNPYPDNVVCITTVTAPHPYTIVVDFEELVLEKEPTCSYDYLEIWEGGNCSWRKCGDWSERLKLLRYVSSRGHIHLAFVSDYSHHYGGFKARLSIEHAAPECGDDRQQAFNRSCYLFVTYPEVTWHTAREICKGIKADLASVLSANEEKFIVTKIRESHEYSTTAIYWLGAKVSNGNHWMWADSSSMVYSEWIRDPRVDEEAEESLCLSLQWTSSPSALLPSGLYWQPQSCDMVGGYVCKKHNQESAMDLNLNVTLNETEGRLTSPFYPLAYSHNLDYWVTIVGPEQTRIVFKFSRLDLEAQAHCLYDFLELHDTGPHLSRQPHRLCGHYDHHDMEKLRLVSSSNVAMLHFRSDYSVSGGGYALTWRAVDTSWCPMQTLTAKEGVITSPNYPHYLLPHLDCSTTILAPEGKRVWLELKEFDVETEDAVVEVVVGGGAGRLQPHSRRGLLSDGVYVSSGERMQIILKTGDKPLGRGFRAVYRTGREDEEEERTVELKGNSSGHYLHINYPLNPPHRLTYTDRLLAPVGHSIHLQFHNSAFTLSELEGSLDLLKDWCPNSGSVVEVHDPYREVNGTTWRLCQQRTKLELPPLAIESYFNSIAIRQLYAPTPSYTPMLNVSISVRPDDNYKTKLLRGSSDYLVETCQPNPCLNGGKCVNNNGRRTCQCLGHFTGMFCGLTQCELEPCLFGECELTGAWFRCICQQGYHGDACGQRHRPCATNPCNSRGKCIETNEASFRCECHAWWEGTTCERRMQHIPYKPLSERMLQEPFWLGLITVTIVLAILGLFWCAKRHFPEKLEKLLAEEDRNRPYVSSSRSASMRERQCSREVLAVQAAPRSLLGRLGIRKPSLLGQLPHPIHNTSRTFSLDDLLKPPPTTPSPRKKRNNSTPTKKTSDKKLILQQLVAPPPAPALSRENSGEAIGLSTNKLALQVPSINHAETSFSSIGGRSLEQSQKLEKKVTFARLLDKVSLGLEAAALGGGPEAEAEAAAEGAKSPNSTSSNQGSDSQSSSELQLDNISGDAPRRPGRGRTASADSILAMFRNFSGVGGLTRTSSSALPSPSTTPTASTPHDDLEDDSTPSSATPLTDSPPLFTKNTILVPVVDRLSAQKNCGNNFLQPPTILLEVANKCLSPIRELPTPSPSPALTPLMPRHSPMHSLSPIDFHINNVSQPEINVSSLEKEESGGGNKLVIPVVTVEEPSPTKPVPPLQFLPGSPPPQRDKLAKSKPLLKDIDKPTSLDLPCPPPVITVTCSMSEMESDTDSPATKSGLGSTSGMTYLSPFSMCSRGDRTTSESNLSSSGYSSMASPGPSRCGSNNPLCPTDVEDNHHAPRRPSPLLRTPCETGERPGGGTRTVAAGTVARRGRSDSETLSDDPHLESNDEGFGTDQLEEKIEEGELKSARELELFMSGELADKSPPHGSVKHCASFDTGLEAYKKKSRVKQCNSVEAGLDSYSITPPPVRHCGSAGESLDSPKVCKVLLQLPSIVVEGSAGTDMHCSPVSSRSESPLSDKTVARFSPMFYGRLTDSDGLYDCNSSADWHKAASKKHSGRRRERKRSKSPTAKSHLLLDVPGKNATDTLTKNQSSRSKPSPKRRLRPQPVSSTSSSSAESLNSIRDMSLCLSSDKLADRLSGDWSDKSGRLSTEGQGEETGDDSTTRMLLNTNGDGGIKKQRKISRMRTVGHQIRFLRRLEQSLKKNRERQSSPERPLLESSPNMREGRSAKAQRMAWLRQRGAASDGLLLAPEDRAYKGKASPTSGHTD